MMGHISISSLLAMGAFMAAGIRFPNFASPALGLGLVCLSAITVVSGVVALL